MKRITKLDILSIGYVYGIIGVCFGLILGLLITALSLIFSGAFNTAGMGGNAATGGFMVGAGSFIVMPIVYGIGGFIAGVVIAFIYNLAAKFTGGIALKLEDSHSDTSAAGRSMDSNERSWSGQE